MTGSDFPIPILRYRNAGISLAKRNGEHSLVRGVDLDVFPNEIVALVGESGSGKTLTALSVLGLLPKGASFRADIAMVNGKDITRLNNRGWRDLRGSEVGIVFQEPLSSLNPVLTIGDQIGEVLLYKKGLARKVREDRAAELLDLMGIPTSRSVLGEYPHQLSGGMRQRVMLAIAMAGEPRLLIADEPTTALDNAIQHQVLELLVETAARTRIGLLFITHDLSVVAQIADRVAVMKDGSLVESAPVGAVFAQPQHAYTRRLVSLAPRVPAVVKHGPPLAAHLERVEQNRPTKDVPLLEVRDLVKRYMPTGGRLTRASGSVALDGVSARIWPGKTLGLVGQSGSGKSSLARVITGLIAPDAGSVRFEGEDIFSNAGREATRRGRDVQMIFQDPFSSLNPRMKIADVVTEPMVAHRLLAGKSVEDAAVELLQTVGLPAGFARRYPHELSGGQRQRVGIARSLGVRPKLLVCDEPVSALDVSVQAEILALFKTLQPLFGLTYLFIAHGLDSIYSVSHHVAVMQSGKIVEYGLRDEVFGDPQHPYTRSLLAAMLDSDPKSSRFRSHRRAV
ncbi:ABC transporter ATP-binding protein [Agrobacterium rhizogenes]|uniref:ABC transporter n=1 Tax=Rhizobium rhizogenes (strain K84 / ATCC BAA-868) TaxID=311403 RepID=B9JQC2_RHIR8|nr:ABC transporter ATP-binding protein [Rhizobium rhizogenes]ACM31341.1 ABC transporter [Rhizobium rhizogenes K84]OCJ22063.1 ABC transporter [Agrobacterium sp. B131/95]OCJ24420.1 ABC transporter [Agrobacterium sp. B133/95]NTI46289.1 ABC transporter ATP-binding protein [Rhizobium rhizogenes]NTI52972.1 ABC transporter ATP-binding protein [Rhizobium rhizogenes]